MHWDAAECGWTKLREKQAWRLWHRASGCAWMYDHMTTESDRWGVLMSAASSLLGLLVGGATIPALAAHGAECEPLGLQIMNAIVGFLIGVLGVFSTIWNLSDTGRRCLLARDGFARIAREMSLLLATPRAERPEAGDFLRLKGKEYDYQRSAAPTVDDKTREIYRERYLKNPVAHPEDPYDDELPRPSPDSSSCSSADSIGSNHSAAATAPLALMYQLIDAYQAANAPRYSVEVSV
jgi:hypothetical protein